MRKKIREYIPLEWKKADCNLKKKISKSRREGQEDHIH